MRSMLSAILFGAAAAGVAHGAPVAEALQRPALLVRDPAHAVLLNAAWAGHRIVAVGERGIIAVSDDEGKRWKQIAAPVSVSLTGVRFADERNGVAIGHGGVVLTTADAGNTWGVRLDGKQAARIVADAAQSAGDAAMVRVAEQLKADGADKPFFDVVLFDRGQMLVVGAYGLAFYSDDGGAHWTSWMGRLDNPRALHLYAARRRGDSVVLVGEQGLLLASADQGKTFKRLEAPYKGSFFTVELPTSGEILVAGLRGNVWRSPDNGASWAQVKSPMPATITASATAADGSVLLANQAGFILRARDGVVVPLSRAPVAMPSGLLAYPDGRLLAVGMEGASQVPFAAR